MLQGGNLGYFNRTVGVGIRDLSYRKIRDQRSLLQNKVMSRIFSKSLYVLFIICVCLVCTSRISAQVPSLADQVFQKYQTLFQREDIQELLPDALTILKAPDIHPLLQPAAIKLVAANPDILKIIVPEIDDKFIILLKEDAGVNALINDPDVQLLLQNVDEIDRLAALLNVQPNAAVISIVPELIESPDIGEQFTVTVALANAQDVASYQATLQFDPEALRFVSWQQGTYFTEDVFVPPTLVEADRLSFAATAPTAAAATDGNLFTTTFEVVAIKASTLSLVEVIFQNNEETGLAVKTQNSRIVEILTPPWDINKDGTVNILDLTLVAGSFGETGPAPSDVNGDNVVNILDLTVVASHFGE